MTSFALSLSQPFHGIYQSQFPLNPRIPHLNLIDLVYRLTEEQIKAVSEGKSLEATDADPHGIRVGKGPDSKLVEVLEKAASDAEVLVSSKVSTAQRTPMDESKILAALDICRGAVMMAYPMGLPEFDTVRQAIEDKEEIEGTQAARDFFDPSTCSIWFAGKKITRDGELSKYVGKTDRVTIKVKITSERVTNAPAREPPVDAETQRQLMAHWHKKQEEAKRLAEQEDQDSYLNSEWANPKQFKQAAQGIGSIKFR